MTKLLRPQPPADMLGAVGTAFVAAPELATWARDTFIEDGGALENEEHAHLQHASVCFCWTTVANARAGHRIVGQCEIMPPMAMGKWQRARAVQQVEEWFGQVPDFLITLDAAYASHVDDATFCSLVEHELYHAGQEMGPFGPKFTQAGKPKFAIRGHDVEELLTIVDSQGKEHLIHSSQIDPQPRPARSLGNWHRDVWARVDAGDVSWGPSPEPPTKPVGWGS